jgi:branched-chain amino acid transport system ATP-binding protein
MENNQKILEVKNVSKFFGGLMALNNISFSVKKGEIYGIVGPNGAGKTTLFNAISGVIKPTKGKIFFDNKDITSLNPYKHAIAGIGRTFQVVRPFAHLSVLENVIAAYGIRFYYNIFKSFTKWKKQKYIEDAEKILDIVGLREYKNRNAKELPLGFQRRLEIARALAVSPKMILLDESFSGLSFSEIEGIKSLVKKLNKDGITTIIIEHNMPVVMELCERVMVINYGETIALGIPDEIINNKEVIEAYLGKKYS